MKTLVCTDGSKKSGEVLRFAGMIKRGEDDLTVLHVRKCDTPLLKEILLKRRRSDSENILLEARRILEGYDIKAGKKVRAGMIEKEIIDEAEDYDLVVIGSEGVKGIEMFFFGALSYKLIENIKKPVLVIKKGKNTLDRILICTGGSKQAERAVGFGGSIAKKTGASVTLLHVIEKSTCENEIRAQEYLDAGQRILLEVGVESETYIRDGERSEEIAKTAGKAAFDLIVMGETGMNPIKLLFSGSVVYEVLKKTDIPCLIVK